MFPRMESRNGTFWHSLRKTIETRFTRKASSYNHHPDFLILQSAAAIAASAFVELAKYTEQSKFLGLANQIVSSLSAAPYLADPAASNAVLT